MAAGYNSPTTLTWTALRHIPPPTSCSTICARTTYSSASTPATAQTFNNQDLDKGGWGLCTSDFGTGSSALAYVVLATMTGVPLIRTNGRTPTLADACSPCRPVARRRAQVRTTSALANQQTIVVKDDGVSMLTLSLKPFLISCCYRAFSALWTCWLFWSW